MSINIPDSHPRAKSLNRRELLVDQCLNKVVAYAGLFAHGRGEAFDYLVGEITPEPAFGAIRAAAAKFLLASHPVISVNGNVAALCPCLLVELAEVTGAKLEINLFYRTREREEAILKVMEEAGGRDILGVDPEFITTIPELQSERRIVDTRGIFASDLVFVPLEDGDRTEALKAFNKYVVTVDLNPLSRTARKADISIVDEVERACTLLIRDCRELKKVSRENLKKELEAFDNNRNLGASIAFISEGLNKMAKELLETEK